MKSFKISILTAAVLGALVTTGCVDNSSSDQNAAPASKATTGVITGFGSVYVNGVEYETTNATITSDDTASSEDDLAIGMVVTLNGSVNADGTTGDALSISYAKDVEGQVISNDYAISGIINVLGQLVYVTADTAFESKDPNVIDPSQITSAHFVEVSGFTSGDGYIHASRIEVKTNLEAGEEQEVKGLIGTIDTAASTFMIGELTVDYSAANLEDLTAPETGLYVEVEGSYDSTSQMLIASKVELEGDGKKGVKADDGEEVEVEGVITSDITETESTYEFELNGQQVVIDKSAVEVEDGDLANLSNGSKIKVEGEIDAEGNLVLDEVKFKRESDLEIGAYVESVDATNKSFSVLGLTVYTNNETVMEDDREAEGVVVERYFDAADLVVGDYVEVKVYTDSNNQLVATKLEREDGEGSIELEGKLAAAPTNADSTITIGGISISLPQGQDLSILVEGAELEVKANADGFVGGVLNATEISLDD